MEEMGKTAFGSCSKAAGSMSALRSSSLKWTPRRLVIRSPSASLKKSVSTAIILSFQPFVILSCADELKTLLLLLHRFICISGGWRR